jgi:hypothetical protein
MALALLIVIGGCGNSELVSAKGKLTYKGQPVPNIIVIFHPKDEGKRDSRAITDDNGIFTLVNSPGQSGAFRGKHKVTLKYNIATDIAPGKVSEEARAAIAKYSDAATSPLEYEIKTSGQLIEIDLK